jgi:hypothetical protein
MSRATKNIEVKKIETFENIEPKINFTIEEVDTMPIQEIPSLILLNEFINSMLNKFQIETLGGFARWAKGNCPAKWSYAMWKKTLDDYLARKVN